MLPVRKLGKNGPELTEIGFGAWAIGGPWQYGWGEQDDKQSLAAMERALELGINWIDTAAVYGLGHSEELVGQIIKNRRESIFVATKCGLVWNEQGKVSHDISPENIRRECENSLRRLNTDYIDLYQIHWPDEKTPVEKAWETMLSLKDEGKVKYVGVSNFDEKQLMACMKLGQVQSLQPQYSMVRRVIDEKVIPYCRENEIGIVAYSPMMSGLLTGKFDLQRLAEDDWRRNYWVFQEPFLSKALEFVDEIRPLAEKYGQTPLQLSIAWVLRRKGITSAIVGARRPEQVEEIVKAAGWAIEDSDMQFIEDKLQEKLGKMLYWK